MKNLMTIKQIKEANNKLINRVLPPKSYASSLSQNDINNLLKKAFEQSNR